MKKPMEMTLTQNNNTITFNLDLDERKDRNFVELMEEFAYRAGITITRIPPDDIQEDEDE